MHSQGYFYFREMLALILARKIVRFIKCEIITIVQQRIRLYRLFRTDSTETESKLKAENTQDASQLGNDL